MTRDEFNAKFQLLNRISDGRVQTYHALAASGAVVMAHFLGEGNPAQHDVILGRLETLDADRRSRVLRIIDVDGAPVIVTKFILDFESFERWLRLDMPRAANADGAAVAETPPPPEATAPDPAPVPEPDAAPADAGDGNGGSSEFTAMFRASVPQPPAPVSAPPTPATPPPTPGGEPPTEAEGDSDGPGEFTRMFLATQAPASRDAAPESPVPPPAAVPTPSEELSPPSSADADASAPADPGEFTRMFSAATPPAEASRGGAGQSVPQQPPPAPAAPAPDSAVPAAPAQPPTSGEFTSLFSAVTPSTVPPATPSPAPPEPPPPGEFTSLFSAATPPPVPPSAPPPDDDWLDLVSHSEPVARGEPPRPTIAPASPSLPGLRLDGPAAPTAHPVPNTAPLPGDPPGEFTRIFGMQSTPGTTVPPQQPGLPGPPPAPPAGPSIPFTTMAPPSGTPGEYTRIISAQTLPPLPDRPGRSLPASCWCCCWRSQR
jgi:hypothetical protein